jgi:hypothetical protein
VYHSAERCSAAFLRQHQRLVRFLVRSRALE